MKKQPINPNRQYLSLLCLIVGLLCLWYAIPLPQSVATSDSQKSVQLITTNIKDIKVGQEVIAYNVFTQKIEKCKVTSISHLKSDHIRFLSVLDNSGTKQTFQTTDGHPFWVVTNVPDLSRSASEFSSVHDPSDNTETIFEHNNLYVTDNGYYVDASRLQPGDVFLGPYGELTPLISTYRKDFQNGIDVYNIAVENNSNYFVLANYEAYINGAQPVLVHNGNCSFKALYRDTGLPNQGKIRYVPPRNTNPQNGFPRGTQHGYIDRFNNEWVKGPSRTNGQPYEWDVQLPKHGGDNQFKSLSKDGRHVNVTPDGRISH